MGGRIIVYVSLLWFFICFAMLGATEKCVHCTVEEVACRHSSPTVYTMIIYPTYLFKSCWKPVLCYKC